MSAVVAEARTAAERDALYQFRYRVYVEEMGLQPPGADHARRHLSDALDEAAISFVLLDDGEVVGSLRLVPLAEVRDPTSLIATRAMAPALAAFGAEAIVLTSRFIVAPNLRNTLAIFRLMEAAFEFGQAHGIRLNYGDCSPHLVPFYEHLGYRRYTRAYNDTEYGFKVPILMLVGDREHFERVRSPLARLARRYPQDDAARQWFEREYVAFLGVESAALLPEGVFFDLLASRVAADPLHSVALLRGLERAEANRFLAEATTVRAAPGDRIVRQGERSDTLYVLLAGVAEVFVDEVPGVPVAVFGAGDLFGEIGFLTGEPRTANVVAGTECELLVLSGPFVRRLVEKQPAIAAKVMLNLAQVLAQRLGNTTRLIAPAG